MKRLAFVLSALLLYFLTVTSLSSHLQERPVRVKLGYTPDAALLKAVSGDQRFLVAELEIVRVLFYFGTVLQQWQQKVSLAPEYRNMFETLQTALGLDPYNSDAYYFAQAAFTWEVGRIREVNNMLDYGMRYRTWDWSLPFYAGFNSAYFLQDYEQAARYMEKAAAISGNTMFTNLAARYFYEAGSSRLGVAFLDTMIKQARDPQVKRLYTMRKEALHAVLEIETAVEQYRDRFGRLPQSLQALLQEGFLKKFPPDPYGGRFYLDQTGRVRSTSAFSKPQLGEESELPGK